jgi:hypothetical protein
VEDLPNCSGELDLPIIDAPCKDIRVEALLHAAGITTLKQLAEAESRIEEIMDRLAAAGDWDGFQSLKDRLSRGRPAEADEPDYPVRPDSE